MLEMVEVVDLLRRDAWSVAIVEVEVEDLGEDSEDRLDI
jgi:hypothetical protein